MLGCASTVAAVLHISLRDFVLISLTDEISQQVKKHADLFHTFVLILLRAGRQ